jgi:hypothetical protein
MQDYFLFKGFSLRENKTIEQKFLIPEVENKTEFAKRLFIQLQLDLKWGLILHFKVGYKPKLLIKKLKWHHKH